MGNAQAKKQKEQKLKKEQQKQQLEELEQKQKLIGTAVLFLEGQKVQQVPQTQRKIFLRKKGLTEEMVDEAYRRIKQKQEKKKDQAAKASTQSVAKVNDEKKEK